MTQTAVTIDALPALPRDQEGPVFREPWEAHAFALAVHLSEAGYFRWAEWVAVVSQEIQAAQEQGDPDLGETYYQHWLKALERMCAAKGLVSRDAMQQRQEAWRRAYRHTPHGQPVELAAADENSRRCMMNVQP
jgi:nitrile hydratase accessory protein